PARPDAAPPPGLHLADNEKMPLAQCLPARPSPAIPPSDADPGRNGIVPALPARAFESLTCRAARSFPRSADGDDPESVSEVRITSGLLAERSTQASGMVRP